jgi:hypothetical protein
MAAYNLIATTTVGFGGAASIAFTGITQTYTDLLVVLSTRSASTGNQIICAVNGSNATAQRTVFGDGGGGAALSSSGATWLGFGDTSAETASVFGNMQIYFPNYAGSANKSVGAESSMENNANQAYVALTATLFGSSAITSLTFTTNSGNFVEYSSASLYGIKNS